MCPSGRGWLPRLGDVAAECLPTRLFVELANEHVRTGDPE